MANGTISVSQVDVLTTSGTGTISIVPPATNTNRTLTLPDATGTIITTAGGAAISGTTGAFTTTVGVGGATPSTSGSGITFPATASASSDANTLDDYEEGTWTPTLPNGGTLSVSSARYVKIGQQVMVSFLVSSVAPTNDGSQFRIGGLPFANGYASVYNGGCFGYTGDSNLSGWLPLTGDSSTYIFFHIATGAGARTNAQYLTAAAGASDEFIITITYFAAT